MSPPTTDNLIVRPQDPILVTGASGFIGPKLVESLLKRGFRNIRAFVRPSSNLARLQQIADEYRGVAEVELVTGNLLSREDCNMAAHDAALIFHLATSGDKSFAGSFMNSVVTTRNLLDSALKSSNFRRFVNVSSFAVYSNRNKPQRNVLDESSPIEPRPAESGDAYCFAKVKQDEIVVDYGKRFGVPYVIVRPGSVYGPGKLAITGRVGIDTFGSFVHMGGSNLIPFTYIDNCADAIVLAGIRPGIDGEVFNVVDDNIVSSRQFLKLYKRNVRSFSSFYMPHSLSYALCGLWEKYSGWSRGQLPPSFNRRRWHAEWKSTRYSNQKLKSQLGWTPEVSMDEGLSRYFKSCQDSQHA